jgi:CheY-like chemotaxis protein
MRQGEEQAVHGSRPMRCLNHRPYILVMMDQNMPIMGGIEGTKQLRDMQRQGLLDPSVKIVLMSGDDAVINENEQ